MSLISKQDYELTIEALNHMISWLNHVSIMLDGEARSETQAKITQYQTLNNWLKLQLSKNTVF